MNFCPGIVPPGGGGGASSSDIARLEENIALNAIRIQIDAGWSYLNMVDGIADAFDDDTGIDSGSSTASYEPTGNYYKNGVDSSWELLIHSDTTDGDTTVEDSGSNEFTMTTNGDVVQTTDEKKFGTTSIEFFDGLSDSVTAPDNAVFNLGASDFTFDFWINFKTITSETVFGQYTVSGNNLSYVLRVNSSTDATLYYSTNGSTFDSISFTISTLATGTWYHMALERDSNTLRFYLDGVQQDGDKSITDTFYDAATPFSLGKNDAGQLNAYLDEFRFVSSAVYGGTNFTPPTEPYGGANFILQSVAFTAEEVPTNGRIIILHKPINDTTLNTDITAYLSRDGGTNFTQVTLEDQGQFDSSINIISCSSESIDSQDSDTSMIWKIQTANEKSQEIHACYLQWG